MAWCRPQVPASLLAMFKKRDASRAKGFDAFAAKWEKREAKAESKGKNAKKGGPKGSKEGTGAAAEGAPSKGNSSKSKRQR